MLKLSKKHNPNYVAQIVKLEQSTKHPNADRLHGWIIQGSRVFTAVQYNPGDYAVYFPVECQIAKEFLSYFSLFRDKDLNQNKEKVGFFEQSCRVKALKLRGEYSEGFILPYKDIVEFAKSIGVKLGEPKECDFDSIGDFQLVKKYIIRIQNTPGSQKEKTSQKKRKHIVENQLNLHYDTEQLKKNPQVLTNNDICVITKKLHGTSFVAANLLVERQPSLLEKVARFFGIKIQDSQYEYVATSRSVVKSIGDKEEENGGYYDYNLYVEIGKKLRPVLTKGLTIYGEAVGFLPKGSAIQKGYDYGCPPNTYDIYVYRITFTNVDGVVYEFDWPEIKHFCEKYGLKHVPELYYGPITFTLEDLQKKYLEKKCTICKNDVWDEGICIRNEQKGKKAYKLKSLNFLGYETKMLDEGVVDLETEETQEV